MNTIVLTHDTLYPLAHNTCTACSSQDIVEGDGGCFSRAKGIVHQLSDGSTIRETKKNIVIKSIPNGDNPGMMEIQTESGKGSAIVRGCVCIQILI